jgi:hypothetical protein
MLLLEALSSPHRQRILHTEGLIGGVEGDEYEVGSYVFGFRFFPYSVLLSLSHSFPFLFLFAFLFALWRFVLRRSSHSMLRCASHSVLQCHSRSSLHIPFSVFCSACPDYNY